MAPVAERRPRSERHARRGCETCAERRRQEDRLHELNLAAAARPPLQPVAPPDSGLSMEFLIAVALTVLVAFLLRFRIDRLEADLEELLEAEREPDDG
ncbi:MAG: hypothetical protein AUI13_07515 [Gemmatimonadetes bacterium 13_2_20CM_2_69_23]|nr:MAG: hypothetical protein AUI13_07515 [Gemmatimonadetes bacterium 13_2_20CM_2_69_23]